MRRIVVLFLALILMFTGNLGGIWGGISHAHANSQYKTLKPGSKGQAVLDARMRLYELGYFTKVPTQTEYTVAMKDYVKKFEKDYGLKQDGILSPEDQEILFSGQVSQAGKKGGLKSIQTGSLITFGHYEQDGNETNGQESITWLVLEKKGNRILVISQYALDCQPYNSSNCIS